MDNLVPHLTFLRNAAQAMPNGKMLTEQLEKRTGVVRRLITHTCAIDDWLASNNYYHRV